VITQQHLSCVRAETARRVSSSSSSCRSVCWRPWPWHIHLLLDPTSWNAFILRRFDTLPTRDVQVRTSCYQRVTLDEYYTCCWFLCHTHTHTKGLLRHGVGCYCHIQSFPIMHCYSVHISIHSQDLFPSCSSRQYEKSGQNEELRILSSSSSSSTRLVGIGPEMSCLAANEVCVCVCRCVCGCVCVCD